MSGLLIASLAGANPATTDTTDVAFTPVTNYNVLSNAYIGANLTRNVVVIGGATPVPTNATTVRVTVTAKGPKAGTLAFYPTGNPAGSNGQTLSWAAGGAVTETITADIGENESLTFKNISAASATVTATLTGFSTDVTAGDISGSGGIPGQVLTNNGAGGVRWATPGAATLPRAFGLVLWDGSVSDRHPSRGLRSATVTLSTEATGAYCISGLDFAPLAVSVTPTLYYSGPTDAFAQIGSGSGCEVGTQVQVNLRSTASNAPDWGSFNILLWG